MSETKLLDIIKEKDDYIAILTDENVKLKVELSELRSKLLNLCDSYMNQNKIK